MDDASLEPGESFTLTATVANAGDGAAAATTLRYRRSADATISTTDAQVETDAVDALAASGSSAESIALTAPTTAGSYHYGACVDAVPDESATSNNCSSAVTVTVREPTLRPDLAVVSVSGPDEPLLPWEMFTLRATVRSVGAADAPRTWIGLYFSEDATVSPSDEMLGYYSVNAMAVGDTTGRLWSRVTAPPSAGTYHYGACVNAVPHESDTTNNCSTVEVTVREPSGRPDLTIMAYGGRCWYKATVTNVGTERSVQTRLTWYHAGSENVFGSPWYLPVIDPGQDASLERQSPGLAAGRYYACVDAPPGETVTDNNCSETVEVTAH